MKSLRNAVSLALLVGLLLTVIACGELGGGANQPEIAPTERGPVSSTPVDTSTIYTPLLTATPVLPPPASPIPLLELDLEVLLNSTYRGILDEAVTLVDGAFEGETFVAGGASRPVVTLIPQPIAYGDLNDDGRMDAAVVLVSDSGGSGSFVYLAAVQTRDGVPDNMATLMLGDRVQVKSLAIEDSRLIARLLSHAPGDPACCPSLEETRYLRLSGNQFVEAGE